MSESKLRWMNRIFRLLLLAYPADFRRQYGREMAQVFRDAARDGAPFGSYTLHILWDWFEAVVHERTDTMTTKLGLGIGLVPAVAFTLSNLVFQIPDNQHEPTLGFFLTVGGLLLVWGVCGYLAARSTAASGAAAMKAGALAGAVSVGVLWSTYIILNNAFIERMSYEPDRIRAFQESGYATMREFVNSGMGIGPFPLLLCVAALAGMAGAAISARSLPAPGGASGDRIRQS